MVQLSSVWCTHLQTVVTSEQQDAQVIFIQIFGSNRENMRCNQHAKT